MRVEEKEREKEIARRMGLRGLLRSSRNSNSTGEKWADRGYERNTELSLACIFLNLNVKFLKI